MALFIIDIMIEIREDKTIDMIIEGMIIGEALGKEELTKNFLIEGKRDHPNQGVSHLILKLTTSLELNKVVMSKLLFMHQDLFRLLNKILEVDLANNQVCLAFNKEMKRKIVTKKSSL